MSATVEMRGAGRTRQVPRSLIFVIVGTANMMAGIDLTIVATALPTLHRALHSPINWAGWTITAFQLGQVVSMPITGRISDQFGRRRVFLVSLGVFTVASLFCGLANSIYVLVPLRAIQALGAGAFFPSATGMVFDHFGQDRERAIGILTTLFPIGAMIGPILGALILSGWSWRGIFFINVPIGIVLVILAIRYLPRSRPKAVARPDLSGAAMLAAAILALMFAITTLGGNTPVLSPSFVLAGLVGLAMLAAFVRHANRADAPVIPLHLIRDRRFATMNIINFTYGAVILGFGALVPFYAQERYHLPQLQAGTLLTARAGGAIIVTGLSSLLLRRIGYRLPILVGSGFVVVAMILLDLTPPGLHAYVWLAGCGALFGIGMGVSSPASNNAMLGASPADVSSISGVRGMFRQAGGIMSISITTAVIARSSNQGVALGHAFFIFAIVLAVIAPLVFTIPLQRDSEQ